MNLLILSLIKWTVRVKYEDLQLTLGTIVVRIAALFLNIANSFMATLNAMAVGLLSPVVIIEQLLNKIGLGTTMFTDALANRKAAMADYAKSAVEIISANDCTD